MKRTVTLAALFLLTTVSAMASQPLRRTVTRQLADGTTVSVERRGSPTLSWWQTADGRRYTLAADNTLRPLADEMLNHDDTQVAATAPRTAAPHKAMDASTANGLGEYGVSGKGMVNSLGSPLIPVIMVAFSDLDFLPGNTIEKVSRFLNEEGYHDETYAVGSVADYFKHNSYGLFTPRFEVVAKVTLPNTHKYYGGHAGSSTDARRGEAIREAVRLAEQQGVDFSKFATGNKRTPLISLLHAGPGEQEDYGKDFEDFFWAHFSQTSITGSTTTFNSYLLSNETMRYFDENDNLTQEIMTGIGTFCHEFGHALGLPDHYDVNGETNGAGQTPGYWDVMDYQFMYDGYRPMEYSAYERSLMGWLHIADLDNTKLGQQQRLQPLGAMPADGNVAYRIVNPNNECEYFLFENRQANPFYQETFLGKGMLAWHINYDAAIWSYNTVNTYADNQRVKVVPADGAWQPNQDLNKRDNDNKRYTFTGDLFPGYTDAHTFDASCDDFASGHLDNQLANINLVDDTIVFNYTNPTLSTHTTLTPQHSTPSYYDLSGRRLPAAPRQGVYLEDGQLKISK